MVKSIALSLVKINLWDGDVSRTDFVTLHNVVILPKLKIYFTLKPITVIRYESAKFDVSIMIYYLLALTEHNINKWNIYSLQRWLLV